MTTAAHAERALDGSRRSKEARLFARLQATLRPHELACDLAFLDVPGNAPVTLPDEPVLPVRLTRSSVVVAPPWGPGSAGPCPVCLQRRWVALRPPQERWPLEDPHGAVVVGPLPYLTEFALDSIAGLCEAAAATRPVSFRADVFELDLLTLAVTRHGLLRDSTCPACFPPRRDTAADAVVRLRPRPKRREDDLRLRSPEDYGLPISALANSVCGTLGKAGMRAYHATATAPVSGFFQVRSRYDLHEMWWSGHAASYARSELLGLLEGLERYAGQRPRGRAPAIEASYAEVADQALDPTLTGGYDDEFYASHHHTHAPFSPDRRYPWVWGYSLRDERPVLVPEQMAYYLDYRDDYPNFVQECSNGCATGSTMEEAVLYGILELIERDAFLLAWYGRACLPRIDSHSCEDPTTQAMLRRVDALGYDTYLYDLRIDLPLPVVMGLAVRRDDGLGKLCFAAGGGLRPEDAVNAALCEVASYVPGFPDRVRESLDVVRPMVDDYRLVRELSHHPLLYGLPEMADRAGFLLGEAEARPLADVFGAWEAQRPRSLDLLDDLRACVDMVLGMGSDLIVVDQTCPEQHELGLRTACVIAPGLVPIDFGWHRQRVLRSERLRTAVVEAGLREGPLGPDDLHRHPHPFP